MPVGKPVKVTGGIPLAAKRAGDGDNARSWYDSKGVWAGHQAVPAMLSFKPRFGERPGKRVFLHRFSNVAPNLVRERPSSP